MDAIQLALLLPVLLAEVTLAVLVLLNNPKSKIHQFFSLLVFSTVMWTLSNYLADHIRNTQLALYSTRIVFLSATSIAVSLAFFTNIFPDNHEPSKLTKSILAGTYALLLLLTLSDLIVSSVSLIDPVGVDLKLGSFYSVFVLHFVFCVAYSFMLLIKKSKRLVGLQKLQNKYLLWGIFVTIIFASATNILIPFLTGNWALSRFGPYFMIIFVASTSYAITKHALFNMKVVLTEIAVISILIILASQIVTDTSNQNRVLSSIIFLAISFFGYILIRSVQSEVRRREEVERLAKEKTGALEEVEERNKNLAVLQKVAQLAINQVELKPMTQSILDEIPKQFGGCQGAMLLIKRDNELVSYAITATDKVSAKVMSMIGGNLEKYGQPLTKGTNQLVDAVIENRVIESDLLSDFVSPPIPKSLALTIQKISGGRHQVAVPLYAANEPLGALLYGFSVPRHAITDRDMAMVKAIGDSMSLAIQRAQAFQKLKDANEYLAQLDNMKDEFISMASHELNTPLAAIEGYLSMILDEGMGKVDEKSRIYLQRAYESSKRLAELVLDLLNVSRIEQGRLKMNYKLANMKDMAQSVIHELQIKADAKKLYLKIDAPADLPTLWCDPDRIREVIVNLIGNALKFTEKGGITVKISKIGQAIRTEVIDTGRGIAKEDLTKLFRKFSQVKREIDQQQGTGLGLYISHNFVELHKGRLFVESEVGKGTKFIFDLPILDKAPVEVKPIDEVRAAPSTKSLNVAPGIGAHQIPVVHQ